jgi:stage V sporulation protein B
LLRILFGNYLGATGLGLYSLVLIIYSIVTLIGALGIPNATVRYVAKFKDRRDELNSFISCSLVNSIILGIISALILYFLSNSISMFFHKPDLTPLIQIISFGVPFFILSNTIIRLFNGLRKMGSYSFGFIFRSVLILVLSLLFIFLNLGIKGPILAITISEIVTTIFVLILSKNVFSFILKDYLKESKELIAFGIQVVLADGTYFLDTNIDTIIVGYFLASQEVGIYSIAIMFSQILFIIPMAISQVTYPMIAEYFSKNNIESIKLTILKSTRYSFFFTSILGLGIILFSKDIIALLLPPQFLQATIPLIVLVYALIFYTPFISVGSLFNAIGKPRIVFFTGIIWVTLNTMINIALIPILGILGAAIATSTTFILRPSLAFYLWNKLLEIKIAKWWYIKSWVALGLLMAFYLYLDSQFNHSLFTYLLKIFIIAIWIFYLLNYLLIEERVEILELLKHILKI